VEGTSSSKAVVGEVVEAVKEVEEGVYPEVFQEEEGVTET
jgi:hypothetical protein